MSAKVLVIGANGQDGSYLVEACLAAGDRVVGCGRQPQFRYTPPPGARFSYEPIDVTDAPALAALLRRERPDRIHHYAAVHGASGFFYEDKFQAAMATNLGSVHVCLEYIREANPQARLLYASSLKAFGDPSPALVREDTPRRSDCLYSITKNAATDLVANYRRAHGVKACVLWLLNHESPRRPPQFFLPRICAALAGALAGETDRQQFASLDFACDWGSARDFVTLGRRLLELDEPADCVMATGRTWTGLEFVETLFGAAGLDWRPHVQLRKEPGSEPVAMYRADISRLVSLLGEGPAMSAIDVARWILKENHGVELKG
jgi:GDPmannose 4,6-dehydratase